MRHQHLGGVGAEVRDPVPGLDARAQHPREPRHLVGELAVGVAAVPVDDRGLVGEDRGRAVQEAQRTERVWFAEADSGDTSTSVVSARDGRYIRSAPTLWATTRPPLPSEVGIPKRAPSP